MNELDGGGEDKVPAMLGVGEIELKPTNSLRLVPWNADPGLGAANLAVDDAEMVDSGGGGKAATEEDCGAGAAD